MTTDSAAGQHPAAPTRRVPIAIAGSQRQLSDRAYQRGDALAHERWWEITATTGRPGFVGRTYGDPRFAARPFAARRGEPVPMSQLRSARPSR